ncbi:tRNA (adenosine(37)-N6)-threonylcarbamoyltransferase complex dimerization subunit type 1 TsaB [Sulfitobacter sp. LCG007]
MPDDAPLILSFDTSAAHCAAALLSDETVLAERREEMARGQSERLLPLCDELLRSAGRDLSALSALGVGIGPGNFTGIRIAVSAARGLALGLGIPAVGVSAFDALRLGSTGPCACAVEAPRGMVYLKVFGAQPDDFAPPEPLLVSAAELPPHDGPLIGACGQRPAHATATAIALIARARFAQLSHPGQRPAPLYLRPADAAPARDAPPRILP